MDMAHNGRKPTETTDLGIGMLIAETEDGVYQPVAAVSTISEGRERAAGDMRRRIARLDQGSDPMCPARYLVWALGDGGEYATVAEIEPKRTAPILFPPTAAQRCKRSAAFLRLVLTRADLMVASERRCGHA